MPRHSLKPEFDIEAAVEEEDLEYEILRRNGYMVGISCTNGKT